VTGSGDEINVTYEDITESLEPNKEYRFTRSRINSPEYVLTNNQYTEKPIRDFWYNNEGEMWESDYGKIVGKWGSELIETFNLIDKQYFFSAELGKELTDITDPYGHLTWTISDCTEENEAFAWQTNIIAFDYIISECNQMVFLDSTFDNERGSSIEKFENHIVPIGDAVDLAQCMVSRAENVLIECWNDNEESELGCMLSSDGGQKYVESIREEINGIRKIEMSTKSQRYHHEIP
jgi:hypothetical protein